MSTFFLQNSRLLQIGHKLEKWQWVTISRHEVIVIFFDVVLYLLSSLVTGPSFMSISSLVLELWQFSFARDWPEIRKSEKKPSEFCPIFGGWGKLGKPGFARISLIKCYWMLENAGVTAFTVSELMQAGWSTQIRVNSGFYSKFSSKITRFFVYSARSSPNSPFNRGIAEVF